MNSFLNIPIEFFFDISNPTAKKNYNSEKKEYTFDECDCKELGLYPNQNFVYGLSPSGIKVKFERITNKWDFDEEYLEYVGVLPSGKNIYLCIQKF